MACILNIDTSGKNGLVTLAIDGQSISTIHNDNAMEHASFLQPAIWQLLHDASISFHAIDAIAVNNGPGSYTGLRVALASAKGLCFAWQKPLITLNSLKVLALSAKQSASENVTENDKGHQVSEEKGPVIIPDIKNLSNVIYCPMIDARRMEVFFALYDHQLQVVVPPAAAVLDKDFLHTYLDANQLIFTGSGMPKWKTMVQHPNAIFIAEPLLDKALSELSHHAFLMSDFDSVDYAAPFYTKEFYTTHPAHHK